MASRPIPIPLLSRRGVLAQYWTIKFAWRRAYPRILTVSNASLATFDPRDLACTNRWPLDEIRYVEALRDPQQFIIVFGKTRFRSTKIRMQCEARNHFLALMETLRRNFFYQPVRFNLADMRRERYPCVEYFADNETAPRMLVLTASALQLLDDKMHEIASMPFLAIRRVARSSLHENGMIISTMYHERLFHCSTRDALLQHLKHAVARIGIALSIEDSAENVPDIAARNADMLQQPSCVCFDVLKVLDEGRVVVPIQLVFQGAAMIEVHRKMRHVVYRPYNTLRHIARLEDEDETVWLQFQHDEDLVIRVTSRAQFVAVLLLVCREAGRSLVELTSEPLPQHRIFHPHLADGVEEKCAIEIESVILHRLAATSACITNVSQQPPPSSSKIWSQLHRRHPLESSVSVMSTRFQDEVGLPDDEKLSRAMEELVTNLPCTGLSEGCDRGLLHAALRVVLERVLLLGSSRGVTRDTSTNELVLALRTLARICLSNDVYLPEESLPRLFHVIHDLIDERTFLLTYWCLKLLQRIFEPRAGEYSRLYRARVLDHFLNTPSLLETIADVFPACSSYSVDSSGRWMPSSDPNSAAPTNPFVSKDEMLEKDMSILTYEAMFTLHYVLIYLHVREKQEQLEPEHISEFRNAAPSVSATASKTKSLTADRLLESRAIERPIPQIKHDLALQMLQKRDFLMGSMVDIRFARTCRTITALLTFVVNELAPIGHARASRRRSSSGSRKLRRTSSPLRISALATLEKTSANNGAEATQLKQLDQLDGFLSRYEADLSMLNDRSRLFQAQETILVPLLGFSQSGITSASFEDSVRRRKSDPPGCLRLEHLAVCSEENPKAEQQDTVSRVDKKEILKQEPKDTKPRPPSEKSSRQPLVVDQLKKPLRKDHRRLVREDTPTETSSLTDVVPLDDLVHNGLPPITRPRRRDRVQPAPSSQPVQYLLEKNVPSRAPPQSARAARSKHPVCDACLCCNDVCAHEDCFYCAEKDYQLQLAFPSPPLDEFDPSYSPPQRSSAVDRKYSSCEVRRHTTRHSCWIVLKGSVYDVTTLLKKLPGRGGGLLKVAQLGKDCGSLLDDRFPEGHQALDKFRLGEYYECERRTVLI